MRHSPFWIVPLSLLLLSACTDTTSRNSDRLDYGVESAPEPIIVTGSRLKRSDVAADSADGAQSAANYLAYRYGYSFELPSASVKATAQSHAQRCIEAGAKLCQVLNTSTRDYDADNVSASLTLRAEPEWLDQYAASLIESVNKADGKMTASSVSAQDLTRQILDVDARLSAQTTLRDRLTGLLQTRDAELADLLALERELARVQAEIESATSNLAALRQRVTMSVVDIDYSSKSRAVSSSAVAPIAQALKDFLRTLSQGLAGVIGFIAMTLPWLIFVLLPVFFGIRWLWRRRPFKSRKS